MKSVLVKTILARTLLVFLVVCMCARQECRAEVTVKSSDYMLLPYKLRRSENAFVLGFKGLKELEISQFGGWGIEIGYKRALMSLLDLGLSVSRDLWSNFPGVSYMLSLGMPRIWDEPYWVPWLGIGSMQLDSYDRISFYHLGMDIGLNFFEPQSGYYLRKEFGLEQVFLRLSYQDFTRNSYPLKVIQVGIYLEW